MAQSYWFKFLGVIALAFVIAGGYLYLKDHQVLKEPVVEPKSQLGAAAGMVEAILGNNNIGTKTDDSNRNALSAFPFTMTEDGTAISMSVYIAKAEAGSQYSLAIYADNAGNPGDLIAAGPNQAVSSTGWYTLPIAANLKANTTYWLTYNTTANTSGSNVLSYTTGSGVYKWHFQTFGTWPTNFGGVNGSTSNLIPSLYLTYAKPAPDTTPTTGGTPSTVFSVGATIVVSQGPVNIRSNPSLSASIVGTANTNDQGVILDGPNYNEGFNWWKVSYKNGSLVGWTTGAYQYTLVGGTTAPVTTAFDFALSYLTSQTVAQGQTTASQVVTVTKNAGTAEAVNLAISGLPTGATASFSPTGCTPNTTCTSNLTVNTLATTPAGTYKLTVTGQAASGLSRTSAFDLTVTAAAVTATTTTPISAPVTNGKFALGDGVRVTKGPLNVRDVPGLRKPSRVLGTQATNAAGVVVDGPKTADRYTWWKIDYATGADGWSTENYLTKTTSAVIPPVTNPTTTPIASSLTFNLSAPTTANLTQGTTVALPITVNITDSNSAQTLSLAVANLPTGVSGIFNPTTCTSLTTGASTCSVSLGLAALGSAPAGTYDLTISATALDQTSSAKISLTVTAAGPISTLFNLGDRVQATSNLNVRTSPSAGASLVAGAPVPAGSVGTITGLAQADSTYTWWKVKFDTLASDGWSVQDFLALFTEMISPTTPVTANAATPSLGLNLEQMTDWQRAYMFVDTIKTARGFWNATGGYTAEGWPIGDFKVLIFKDANRRCLSYDANWNCLNEVKDSNDPDLSGTYSLSFTGKANVTASALKSSASVQNLVYANGVTTGQVVVNPGAIDLWLYFSGTNGLPITNIKLYRPGYPLSTTQVFTNEFLESIKPFSTIRLMDFQATNWFSNQTSRKKIVNWSDRPNKNDPIQDDQEDGKGVEIGNGVAVEWAVDLANVSGKDLWINIPHTASADYIAGLANYLKTNLNSNSKVYLEFGNEMWNDIFKQSGDIKSEAVAYVNSGQTPRLDTNQADINNELYWGRHLTIKKLADASNIFRSVFGDAAMMTRIRPVFADQSARYSAAASALAWLSRSYPNPVNYYLYGVANAPYYGAANADTGSVNSILTGPGSVEDGINNRMGGEMLSDSSRHSYFYTLAQTYGLKNVTYEGGTDLGQGSTNIANKIAASYDPRMENITKGYLAQWYACGDGDLFMYFDQSNVYSTSGQWGLTDDVRRDYNNPSAMAAKMKGARDVVNADSRTFECASIGNGYYAVNPNGVLGTGTGLLGTYYSDQNFGTVKLSRLDPIINFIWGNYGTGGPFPSTRNDGRAPDFSVKWTGQIMPKFTGTYTFTLETDTDDVATLSVNGQSLGLSGNVTLTAGQKYPIQMSLKPGANGSGKARLWWSTTDGQQIRSIVPKSQLFSN